jgi:hypothetical protein
MRKILKHASPVSRIHLGVFILIFAIIGGVAIWRSFAAPNPSLPGDLNNDNTVNVTDMSILLSNYGTASTTADINGDGTVNVLDMSLLLSHYGQSVSALGLSSSSIQAGQMLSGAVNWTVTTTGSVASVEFWANNQKLATLSTTPYTYQLDTTTMPNGSNSLGVAINGTDGSRITPQIGTVTVSNSTGGGGTGTVTWSGDFETNDFSEFDNNTQCAAGQATVTTNASSLGGPTTAKHGTHFFQSITKSGDNILQGERCEVLKGGMNASNGSDQYYGWSMAMPSNYPAGDSTNPPGSLIGQFHSNSSDAWASQADIQISTAPNRAGANYSYTLSNPGLILGINGGYPYQNGQYSNINCAACGVSGNAYTSYTFDLGPLSQYRGTGWVNFVFHIVWSDHATGTVELLRELPGQTSYTSVAKLTNASNLYLGYSAYLKLGTNRASSTSQADAIDWFDSVKQGTSQSAVSN